MLVIKSVVYISNQLELFRSAYTFMIDQVSANTGAKSNDKTHEKDEWQYYAKININYIYM